MEDKTQSNPYAKEEKKSLAEVVISQIDKCAREFSKEMKQGYKHETVIEGQIVTVVEPDQRLLAINHTKTLYDLMLFFFDKQIIEKIEAINTKINEAGQIFFEKYLKLEQDYKAKYAAEKSGEMQQSFQGNRSYQSLLNYKAECYRDMFRELILLFKRKNELSGKRTISWKDE